MGYLLGSGDRVKKNRRIVKEKSALSGAFSSDP